MRLDVANHGLVRLARKFLRRNLTRHPWNAVDAGTTGHGPGPLVERLRRIGRAWKGKDMTLNKQVSALIIAALAASGVATTVAAQDDT
ncbi:MAG: hypothetical protein NWQ37_08935, partial [Marivita lacus]|nr:hypothetical protein [Marivita lacus]